MIRRAIFWSYAGQFAMFFVNFAGSVVIARLLSPRELGVYGVALATTGVLQLFAAFNVGAFVIREARITDDVVETAFTVNAVLSAALAVALFLLGFAGARLLGEPAVASTIQILALLPLFGIFSFRATTLLQRAMAFRGTSILAPFSSLLSIAVTVTAALNGYSYLSPALGTVTSSLFATLVTIWIGREHFSLRVSTHRWREMSAFGLRLMSIGGVAAAAVRVSEIVIAHFLGLAALGLYNRASNLNGLLFQNVYATATRVVFIRLSAVRDQPEEIGPVFVNGFRLITGIMGPILIGLSILAMPVIHLLYGPKWLASAPLLSIIFVAQFLSMAFAMNWELFVLRDRMAQQTRLEIARSVLGVVTTTIGSTISLVAVALSALVDTVISLAIYGRLMPGLIGTDSRSILKLYAETAALTVAACLPVAVTMIVYRGDPQTPWPLIAAAIAAGVALWGGCLYRLDHPVFREARYLVGKLRTTAARGLPAA